MGTTVRDLKVLLSTGEFMDLTPGVMGTGLSKDHPHWIVVVSIVLAQS